MEKTRFEPFAAGELRVLRMACYEAGAAFGDPGHTAEDRATLDDLAVEIIGELKKKTAAEAAAPKEIQIAMQVEKTVVDQPEKPLTFAFDFGLPRVVNPEVQIVAPEKPNPAPEKPESAKRSAPSRRPAAPRVSTSRAQWPADTGKDEEPTGPKKYTGLLYIRCQKCGQERGFCAKTPVSSAYCRECGAPTPLRDLRQIKIWCECGACYRYFTNIQDPAFDMPCLACEAPVALEWNEHKGRYQPMNSEPPKVRKGRKSTKSKGENTQ